MPFVEENFPHLVQSYKKRYANRAFLPPEYNRRISALVKKLCLKYKVGEREDRSRRFPPKSVTAGLDQLALFANELSLNRSSRRLGNSNSG